MFGGSLWEIHEAFFAICGEKYDWKQPNRLLVAQSGDSIEQAKVFKARAVLQGLCANLINALQLLANQQEDGDGFLQNVVKNLGKDSRRGLTDELREIIMVDNERALDVGALRRGTGTFLVWKPKALEGGSDVIVRESPDESTFRAGEVNSSKALINVNHIEPERWGPRLMLTGIPSAKRCTTASKEKIGKKCMSLTKKRVGLWVSGSHRKPRRQKLRVL